MSTLVKFNGVLAASLVKVKGKAIASIVKIGGATAAPPTPGDIVAVGYYYESGEGPMYVDPCTMSYAGIQNGMDSWENISRNAQVYSSGGGYWYYTDQPGGWSITVCDAYDVGATDPTTIDPSPTGWQFMSPCSADGPFYMYLN